MGTEEDQRAASSAAANHYNSTGKYPREGDMVFFKREGIKRPWTQQDNANLRAYKQASSTGKLNYKPKGQPGTEEEQRGVSSAAKTYYNKAGKYPREGDMVLFKHEGVKRPWTQQDTLNQSAYTNGSRVDKSVKPLPLNKPGTEDEQRAAFTAYLSHISKYGEVPKMGDTVSSRKEGESGASRSWSIQDSDNRNGNRETTKKRRLVKPLPLAQKCDRTEEEQRVDYSKLEETTLEIPLSSQGEDLTHTEEEKKAASKRNKNYKLKKKGKPFVELNDDEKKLVRSFDRKKRALERRRMDPEKKKKEQEHKKAHEAARRKDPDTNAHINSLRRKKRKETKEDPFGAHLLRIKESDAYAKQMAKPGAREKKNQKERKSYHKRVEDPKEREKHNEKNRNNYHKRKDKAAVGGMGAFTVPSPPATTGKFRKRAPSPVIMDNRKPAAKRGRYSAGVPSKRASV